MNCSEAPAGPAQVSTLSFWDSLVLVPYNFCPFDMSLLNNPFRPNNPANRVKLTPTAAVTIRSMYAFAGNLQFPSIFRLTSSTGDAANITCTTRECVSNFEPPVHIPAGGYATLELVQGLSRRSPPWQYTSWPMGEVYRLSEVLRQVPSPPLLRGLLAGSWVWAPERHRLAQFGAPQPLQPTWCPDPHSPPCACRPLDCKYDMMATGSTDPTSQTAPGNGNNNGCYSSLTVTAPYAPAYSATYSTNCSDPADTTVGPAQVYTDQDYGLALVLADSCAPDWQQYYSSNNPAARVALVPTNTTGATALWSLYFEYYYLDYTKTFTFRLTSSSGQVVDAPVTEGQAEDGYGAVGFPEPLLIPVGGNATIEVVGATPEYSPVRCLCVHFATVVPCMGHMGWLHSRSLPAASGLQPWASRHAC